VRRPTSVVCIAVAVALVGSLGAPPSATARPLSSAWPRVTKIYTTNPTSLVGDIHDEYGELIMGGSYGECWVHPVETSAGLAFYAGQTHHTDGGAVPSGPGRPNRWKVWNGRRLLGIIVLKSKRRANLFERSGKKVGYTVGPDPVAAGAAFFIGCGTHPLG
jgi:hypothetical protein